MLLHIFAAAAILASPTAFPFKLSDPTAQTLMVLGGSNRPMLMGFTIYANAWEKRTTVSIVMGRGKACEVDRVEIDHAELTSMIPEFSPSDIPIAAGESICVSKTGPDSVVGSMYYSTSE